MTSLAFVIVSNELPFLSSGFALAEQVRVAVDHGLWINYLTLEVGVDWVAA